MKKKLKPILVIKNFNLASWKNKRENVYLSTRGDIYCTSFQIKDYRDRRCKRWYDFLKEYLDMKRRQYDITGIFEITIGDLRHIMWAKNMKSISRKRIEEIVHWENQIGNIKDNIIKRVKKYIVDQIYKERLGEIEN